MLALLLFAARTLLDPFGCHWFRPGPLGEVLPVTKTITVKKQNF